LGLPSRFLPPFKVFNGNGKGLVQDDALPLQFLCQVWLFEFNAVSPEEQHRVVLVVRYTMSRNMNPFGLYPSWGIYTAHGTVEPSVSNRGCHFEAISHVEVIVSATSDNDNPNRG
jgi:hypothetical protein